MIGKTIGSYKFVSEIGEGGMGIVYLVEHVVLGKKYAAKVLDYKLARKKDLKERFLREAKAQALLQHKNIVSVVDYVEDENVHFLVTEYIEGRNLAQYMIFRKKKMGIKEILRIMEGPIEALNYVHSKGVIHRDIKPSNILIDKDGIGYITDFGIALILGLDQMTKTAAGMGTPHYMSPEQAINPRNIDHRSDIYSLGCILFEMASGEPPFDGETAFQILQKQKEERPPLEKISLKFPQYFSEAVNRSLAKNPDERFTGCSELLKALKSIAWKNDKKPKRKSFPNNDLLNNEGITINDESYSNPIINKIKYTYIWTILIILFILSIIILIYFKQQVKQKELSEKANREIEKTAREIEKQSKSLQENKKLINKLKADLAQRSKHENDLLEIQREEVKKREIEAEAQKIIADRSKIEQAEIEKEKLKQHAENLFNQSRTASDKPSDINSTDSYKTHSEKSNESDQISNDFSSINTNDHSEENGNYLIKESDLDKQLTLIYRTIPSYPTYYLKKHRKTGIKKSGIAKVAIIISNDGSVANVRIIGGDNDRYFNEEALKALYQWKYKSPLYKNKPVKTQTIVEIKFE